MKVHYSTKNEGGSILYNSRDWEPLEFVVGEKRVIGGVEKGVIGMQVGDQKKIKIPPEDAFGPVKKNLVLSVLEKKFPDNVKPISIGQHFRFKQSNGKLQHATVVDIKGDSIILDGNHPLAGKTLLIEVEVMDIY